MKVQALLGLLLVSLSACPDDPPLMPVRPCGQPCYVGPQATRNIGACADGQYVCEDDKLRCEGSRLPSPEVCDFVDNDCDLTTDENASDALTWYFDYDGDGHGSPSTAESCTQPPSYVGEATDCDDLDYTVNPDEEEVCNGKDDNCDGKLDDPESLKPEFCYDGDPAELEHVRTSCNAGIQRCEFGEWICHNQQLPSEEICDQYDNDCDGFINEDLPRPAEYDFVFIFDQSGSMIEAIEAVKEASISFVSLYGSPDFRFALVVAPGSAATNRDEAIGVVSDFSDAASFTEVLQAQQVGNASFEPLYDAIHGTCTGSIYLAWRSCSNRVVVFFGDESGQTARNLTEEIVGDTCAAARVTVHGFVKLPDDFDGITGLTGGTLASIDLPAQEIVLHLERSLLVLP